MNPISKPASQLAWLADPVVKADALARMRAHREADSIIQGHYLELDPDSPRGYRGCFHGCRTTEIYMQKNDLPLVDMYPSLPLVDMYPNPSWYRLAAALFGIPTGLSIRIEDIFESLDDPTAAGDFAVAVIEAIPVGADLYTLNLDHIDSGVEQQLVEPLLAALRSAPVVATADA